MLLKIRTHSMAGCVTFCFDGCFVKCFRHRSSVIRLRFNKKNYNMKYHVIQGHFKWLINVSPSLEGIRYPRSVYVLSFVCFFLLLLLFLYSLEKQFGWFLTHNISRLHI